MTYQTREAWLDAACEALVSGELRNASLSLPCARVRVSCGFPSRGATSARARRIGECWDGAASADGTPQLFISPVLSTPSDVLATLMHELIHAAVGCKEGHRGAFKRAALAIGLEGKMTATIAGTALAGRLATLADTLGMYPHAALKPQHRERPGSRLLKAACPACGAILRVTAKLVEFPGLPVCACDGETRFETV